MNEKIECPVCKHKDTDHFLERIVPTFLFPVPKELIKTVRSRNIRFNICNNCSHVFQVNIDMEVIELIYNVLYDHYNLDTSLQFQDVYHKRFKEFFIKNSTVGKLLDIGCNKAPLFHFFESMGFECYGIEPSKANADIASENNPTSKISNTFFERSEENVFNEKFDTVMTNFVMEHIINLDVFFETLKMYTKMGTRLFVQVPDIDYYINNSVDPFLAHEHINYFTNKTLKTLLERQGFEVIDVLHGTAPSLILCAKYTGEVSITIEPDKEAIIFKKQFIQKQKDLAIKIRELIEAEDSIILYGMGLTAVWISHICKEILPEKLILIDDNLFYRGKIKPGYNISVQPCPKMRLENELIIMTTTPPYFTKIKELIKQNFKGTYRVGRIENNDIILEAFIAI